MKKLFILFVSLFFIPVVFLTSCNKSDSLQQILPKPGQDTTTDEAGRNHGCGPSCPASVPEALNISYSITYSGASNIGLSIDVFYNNPDAPGNFRVVLRNVTGNIDSVNIVPAQVTAPGQTTMFHLNYNLPGEGFPYTLNVNGRPGNSQCPGRSRKSFQLDLNVSR